MELRSAGIQRLLVAFVCCVFCYVIFYNSLFLDRRGSRLPGRLPFQQPGNASLSAQPAEVAGGRGPAPPEAAQEAAAPGTGGPQPTAQQAAQQVAVPDTLKPTTKQPPPAEPTTKPSAGSGSGPTIGDMLEGGFQIANADRCPDQGRQLQLVILITSAPAHERQRKAIRLTWGGAVAQRRDVALAFFVGQTSKALQRVVDAEQETYGDMVQGNFVDAYRNLTLKSVSMLEWLETHCAGARTFLKTDDDMFINTDNLLTFVRLHAEDTNTLFGKVARRWRPIRSVKSKYYLSPKAYPGKYFPDFATGPAYLLTGDLAPRLYKASLGAVFIALEDVFLTGVVGQAIGVKRVHAREFINDRIKIDTCKFATAVSVHMVKFEEQFDIWKRVQDGRSQCPRGYQPTAG